MSSAVKMMAAGAGSIFSLFNSVRLHFLRMLRKKTFMDKLRAAGL